ncbi:MAG: VWA domain-containing protein [Bryobacteraceae bacterium]
MTRMALCLFIASTLAVAQRKEPLQDEPSSVFRVETRLVEVYASVLDRRGNPVPNLARDRFQIFDGGRIQPLHVFEGAEERLSCALLLDLSGSMNQFLPVLKNSVLKFVDQFRSGEELAVYAFGTSFQLVQPFTADKKLVKQAVLRTRAQGTTALFDAVAKVSRDLEARKGKKALVLFTDGNDNASTLTSEGASRRAFSSGIPVYAIAQGDALKSKSLIRTQEAVAADTGGLAFQLKNPKQIARVFAEISRNLRHTYLLAWKPPQDAGPAWRAIRIVVAGLEGVRIRARRGYFASNL